MRRRLVCGDDVNKPGGRVTAQSTFTSKSVVLAVEGVSVIETQLGSDRSVVCKPRGALDWIGAVSLRHVIDDLTSPGVHLVIDLSDVYSVDAVGLSALVGSVRRVRAAGGSADVREASFEVRRWMELTGVNQLLAASRGIDDGDAA